MGTAPRGTVLAEQGTALRETVLAEQGTAPRETVLATRETLLAQQVTYCTAPKRGWILQSENGWGWRDV